MFYLSCESVKKIHIISVIGLSGSGKTHFIKLAIKLLKKNLNLESGVIKNIHEHQIDEEGKDSFEFARVGANYSITKNIHNETTLFLKKELDINTLIKWLNNGPLAIDIIFLEGFRKLDHPMVLCVRDPGEFPDKINDNVKMISGTILKDAIKGEINLKVPIIDIEKDFQEFVEIFKLK